MVIGRFFNIVKSGAEFCALSTAKITHILAAGRAYRHIFCCDGVLAVGRLALATKAPPTTDETTTRTSVIEINEWP